MLVNLLAKFTRVKLVAEYANIDIYLFKLNRFAQQRSGQTFKQESKFMYIKLLCKSVKVNAPSAEGSLLVLQGAPV